MSVGTNSEGASFIKAVADKIEIFGLLKTKDITVGNGASHFYADGSGDVASGSIKWDTEGNLAIKGDIQVNSFCPIVKNLIFSESQTSIDLDLSSPCYFYEIIDPYPDNDTKCFINLTGTVFNTNTSKEALFYIRNDTYALNKVFLRFYTDYEVLYFIPWEDLDKTNTSFYRPYVGEANGTTLALFPYQTYMIKAATYNRSDEHPNLTSLEILSGYLTGE